VTNRLVCRLRKGDETFDETGRKSQVFEMICELLDAPAFNVPVAVDERNRIIDGLEYRFFQ